jgi:hypothetical protein
MEAWMPFFVAVTALAVVLQSAIMVALYLSVRKTSEKVTKIAEDFERRSAPILSRMHLIMDDLHPRVSTIVANAAEITEVARRQTYKVDRVFTEAVDRLRVQVVRADQILSGALEGLEEAGVQFRRTVWEPVQNAAALLRGIKSGIDAIRGMRRPPQQPAQGEEELFI